MDSAFGGGVGLRFSCRRLVAAAFVACGVVLAAPAGAQAFATLYSFCSAANCADGTIPSAALTQGVDGNFFGTTGAGGAEGDGTAFTLTPAGALTTLDAFCLQGTQCAAGSDPAAALTQVANGDFYGTTASGGAYGHGTVFRLTPGGTLTTLHSFCRAGGSNCADGRGTKSALLLARDGNFYGTTSGGGTGGQGVVYSLTPGGKVTTLYNFCSRSSCADGASPLAALIQATDGNFYGTTFAGGSHNDGVVFRLTPAGKLTTLHSFCSAANCADGSSPQAPLIQAADGNFYGTASGGALAGAGTVFRLTPAGAFTTVYSFCSETDCTDGLAPEQPLIEATDGNFYSVTLGGPTGHGTIFRLTPGGSLTTLYSFCSAPGCVDGSTPQAPLIQATDGNFYGTTFFGGAGNEGSAFRLASGLGAFISPQPAAGAVGSQVILLGTELEGTSGVAFNGAAARFSVNSTGSAITAKVPAGATTGPVTVVTPHGTLTSNVPFRVE